MRNNRLRSILSHARYITKPDLDSNGSITSPFTVILLLYWYTAQLYLPDETHVLVSLSLQCYSHLTEWGDLEKAALVNVDDSPTPRLERVWEDSYYHVSYINIKALCFSQNFGHIIKLGIVEGDNGMQQ